MQLHIIKIVVQMCWIRCLNFGRGPFGHLPPWHRPSWWLSGGMCCSLFKISKEEEVLMLENESKILEQELERIRKRLEELKKS